MSERDTLGGPINPSDPADAVLIGALDGLRVPELPSDFADRVMLRASDRAAPLPHLRKTVRGPVWRSARRAALGLGAFGALATAAAATGLLDDLPIELPSAQQVWSTLTGRETADAAAVPPATGSGSDPAMAPTVNEPVVIEGPIDTPEELEEAFSRIDRVRDNRKATRRGRVDRQIDNVLERRREQGLPVPNAEQEERLKQALDNSRTRRDERVGERIEQRRDGLRERIEQGEELLPGEIIREEQRGAGNPRMRERIERLRDLPPAQRRGRLRQFRERRQQRREERLDQEPQQGEGATGEAVEADPPAEQPVPVAPEQAVPSPELDPPEVKPVLK
ncbi:MAG: hypothetical protein AAF494_12515 [Pseudomonadota bacterium]